MPRGTDNFDFKDNLIGGRERPFLGYVSYYDKTDVDPRSLIKGSQNVFKTLRGTIASRFGLKRFDTLDATSAGVKSSYEFFSGASGGTIRPMRVANNKLQTLSNIEGTYQWYDLLLTSSLTSPAASLTRFDFATWYDSYGNSDRLLMVRGDNVILHWSGGITKVDISAGVAGGISGIGISNSGTGYVVGDELTVTGGGGTGGKIIVYAVSGGSVTAISLKHPGSGYSVGTGNAVTGGSGSGFLLNITSVASVYTLTKEDTTETWRQAGFAGDTGSQQFLNNERKAIIDGVEITYYGDIDTTSVVTVENVSAVTDDIVISSVLSTTINNHFSEQDDLSSFNADFFRTLNNQVLLCSYSSRQVLLSTDESIFAAQSIKYGFANFSKTGSTYVPGDPDRILLDNPPTAIVTKGGKAYISAGDADWYVIEPNFFVQTQYSATDYSGSSKTRVIITRVDKKTIGTNTACKAHEFIDMYGDDILFLDQSNQLRTASILNSLNDVRWPILSLPIYTEIKSINFSGGHLRKIDNTVFITAPADGLYLMYEMREIVNEIGELVTERFWQPPQVAPIQRFAVFNGIVYGHSSVNPQMYKIFDTGQWFDDDPSGEQIGYTSIMRMAYRSHGKREGLLYFDKVYVEGYLSAEELKGYVFIDYQGANGIKDLDIHTTLDPATTFYTTPPSLGDSSLGLSPMGTGVIEDTNEQEALSKFRAIVDVDTMDIDCFEYALQVYTTKTDSRWEILCLGTNAVLSNEAPTFIRK